MPAVPGSARRMTGSEEQIGRRPTPITQGVEIPAAKRTPTLAIRGCIELERGECAAQPTQRPGLCDRRHLGLWVLCPIYRSRVSFKNILYRNF